MFLFIIEVMAENIANNNLNLIKWIYALSQSSIYFFLIIYFYEITGSYFLSGNIMILKAIIQSIAEVPTGIISDKFLGRKNSYLVATFLDFLSYVFYILGSFNYIFLIIGRIFMGLGTALSSGNRNALLYDSLRDEEKEQEFHQYFSKCQMYQYFWFGLFLLASGALAHYYGTIYVVYFCAIQRFIAFLIGFFLKEPKVHVEQKNVYKNNSVQHLNASIKAFIENKYLFLIGITYILKRGFILGTNRFNATFYTLLIPMNMLGVVTSISLIVHSVVSKYSHSFTNKFGKLKALLYIEIFAIPLQLLAYFFLILYLLY